MKTLIDLIERCHELLVDPDHITLDDAAALMTSKPKILSRADADPMTLGAKLRGYSRAECKRRGVSVSDRFATPDPDIKWVSVKFGKRDYEAVFLTTP